MTEIDTLFDLLDAWRHFPSYQLKCRADLYFALYLPEVLEAQFGFPVQPQLVPEFPLRIGTLDPDQATSASYKVDYVALSAARDKALLVELKTDPLSRRDRQDAHLLAAQQVGLHGLLAGLLELFRATNAQENVINFRAFAEGIDRHDDALSKRFAQSLRERALAPAVLGLPGQVWVALDEDLAAEAARRRCRLRRRRSALWRGPHHPRPAAVGAASALVPVLTPKEVLAMLSGAS